MKGKLTIYRPNQPAEVRELKDRRPTLEELQALVGDYIQRVPGMSRTFDGERCVAYCDENGGLKNLPRNRDATVLWISKGNQAFAPGFLVGNVVVLSGDRRFLGL